MRHMVIGLPHSALTCPFVVSNNQARDARLAALEKFMERISSEPRTSPVSFRFE